MPSVSGANLTRLRTKQHKTKLYLAVYHPTSMWTAQVDGNHTAYATAITVKGAAGTTPVADYEVWFGSSAGLMDIGRSRVKSLSGATLTIAPNNMDLAGDEYITVKQNIVPASIQPNCGTTIYENWDTAYTNQNTQYRPLARMGAPACAFIDANTGLATVKFWSDSEAISGTLSSYLWTTPSGSYTVGNSTTAGTAGTPNEVTWNTAGQYWCSLRVTDSNGNTHTTYRPVFIFNRNSGTVPYSQIEIQSLEGSQESGGWTCSLTVRGTADKTAFPELAQVVIFADDYYDDELTSIGGDYTWRENIVFVGFVQEGSVKAHAWNQTIELKADGVGVLMEKLPGYAANLIGGTPGGWHTMSGMTYKLAAYHLITEHSTVDLIADVDLSPISTSADRIDLVASSLKDQIATQCLAPVRSVLGSSRLGRLYARQQPQLVAAASRTEAIVLDTANTDFRDTIDIVTERELKQVAQIDFNGFKFVSTEQTPVLSLAPGVPWDSGRFERVDGIYVDTQANSNIISGYFEGRANNPYPEVSIKWRGNYRVFDPFPVEKIRLNLTTAQNNRGIAWTNKTFWTKRVSMNYRAGILLVDTSVEGDIVGIPGITGNYPADPPAPPGPVPPEPIVNPPVVIPPTIPQGRGDLLYVCAVGHGGGTGGVAKCVGAFTNAATCTWSAVNTGLAGAALQVYSINFDPFSYNGTNFERMWASTADGLYLATGLPNAVSWSKKLDITSAAALLGVTVPNCFLSASFTPNVRLANFIMTGAWTYEARAEDFGNSHWYFYTIWSTDNGSNWNVNKSYFLQTSQPPTATMLAMWASYHTTAYYIWAYGGDISGWEGDNLYPGGSLYNPLAVVFRATTLPQFSAAMTYKSGFGNQNSNQIITPYCDALGMPYTDDNVLFIAGAVEGGGFNWQGVNALRRYTNAFNPAWSAGYTPPTGTSIGDSAMTNNILFMAHLFNEDYIYAWANDASKFWVTQNGGTTWTYTSPFVVGGNTMRTTNVFLVPAAKDEFFAVGFRTSDNKAIVAKGSAYGATLTDIETGSNSLNTVLGIAGGDMAQSIILVDYYKV